MINRDNNILNIDITNVSDIELLYNTEIIDKSLYKGLINIFTHVITDYEKSYRVSSHNIRTKRLWNNFKLWYLRSNNKLTLHSLYQVLKLIKIKTYYIDMHDYTNRKTCKTYSEFMTAVFNEGKLIKSCKVS